MGAAGSYAQGHRISGVVLLALLHESLDRLGRDKFHVVPGTGEYAAPVMRCTACLYNNGAAVLFLEEWHQLAPAQLAPEAHFPGLVDSVDLKERLGGITGRSW